MEATIVSVVPRTVVDHLPGLHPENYSIPAAINDIEVITVVDSFYYVYRLEGEHIRVDEPGERIAKALVSKYITSTLATTDNGKPGLFWVAGKFTKEEVKKKFAKEIADAIALQNGWFQNLVEMADDVWARFRQHRMISDLQRDACRALGFEREWVMKLPTGKQSLCPACAAPLPMADVTVCQTCHTIIDPKRHAEKFKVA